ncbi:efflux RND transporter periplasmic adaptor subunit [Pedobacter cryoconitis]|uniref:Membrane fusion protein (Multidrug efflux system) n=1 Tax=Pedobacter cryoconitis TaxID=188932 RepID=A0A7X0JA29_9SPHI|nr:efflux RND transporter periplasmic adaptor subunit [Pedobacter cryoconitis]MBB6502556.1 membrane fusion protein (multidrug efflux system) [Pedobacter cryoconitis]
MKTTIIYICLSATLILASCGTAQKPDQQETLKAYPVLSVLPQQVDLSAEYPVTLQGEQTVEIRSKIDGYIEKVYVTEGTPVRQGQPLFKIDANSFEQETNSKKAAVLAAQANLETASIQTERTKVLVEKKIVNSFELTSARNVEQVKRAELNQAKADLSAARSKLAFTNIVSPINGTVGSLPYKIGSLVSSTSEAALTTIANTKKVYAYFSLSQQQLSAFLKQYSGNQPNDKFRNMPEVALVMPDGEVYQPKGRIETLSGVLNSATGAANFKAVFPNPEAKLWSGASATIRIPSHLKGAILAPKSATFELQGKYFVFKVDQQHVIHHTSIEIMDAVTEKDYVVTKGLVAGDQIVTEGLGNLKNGMKIKPNPSTTK